MVAAPSQVSLHVVYCSADFVNEFSVVCFAGSVANLANAAIGGGVLAFPLAFMSCGYIVGFAVSFGFAAIMGFTLHILGMASEVSRATSYQGLVRALLGPTAGKIISISMTIYLFGSCIAYLNIISDQIFESILERQASLEV